MGCFASKYSRYDDFEFVNNEFEKAEQGNNLQAIAIKFIQFQNRKNSYSYWKIGLVWFMCCAKFGKI